MDESHPDPPRLFLWSPTLSTEKSRKDGARASLPISRCLFPDPCSLGPLFPASSRFRDDEVDGRGEAAPVGGFGLKLLAAGGSERVELGLTAGFAFGPAGLDPALLLEPM